MIEKPSWERKVSLSRLNPAQRLMRELLIETGELAYGPHWQTAMSADLTKATGRNVSQAQISHWISGARAFPDHYVLVLEALAFRLADDLDRRAARIRFLWPTLEDPGPVLPDPADEFFPITDE